MNEMLANQYFIVNRFKDACYQFEKILVENPSNDIAKKKLIVCYLQTGDVQSAFKLFTELITTNPATIIENEINIYEKPCKNMISLLEKTTSNFNENERVIALGILWMYCDVNNAKKEFKKMKSSSIYNIKIKTILIIINHLISKLNKEKDNGKETLLS